MTSKCDIKLDANLLKPIIENGFDGLGESISILLNEAMKLERSHHLNADNYERSKERDGYASGYKPKTIKTRMGSIPLQVPQVRESSQPFYPKSIEKGSRSERALKLAIYTTIFSVIGGVAGYMIGHFFYDEIGIQIIEKFNLIDEFNLFSKLINEYGYLFIFIAGFTPIPYKIAAITSGLVNIPLVGFIFFSVISRGPRFIVEALLCKYLGKKAEKIIRDYSFLFTILLLILFILIIIYKEIL